MDSAFTRTLLQAAVIGIFGGASLVLTQMYSRRGPLIYPVYAAILFALALSLSRAGQLGFAARFVVALTAMVISTAIAMSGTMVLSARSHRALPPSMHPLAPGHIPAWAGPLLLLLLSVASAAAAFVSL